jgi:hypothetical protein
LTAAETCDALAAWLRGAVSAMRWYSYNELPEAHNETPAGDVFPDEGNEGRLTFQDGARRAELTVLVDLYIKERANLSEDMAMAVGWIDRVNTALRGFNASGRALDVSWSWERATLEDSVRKFAGARFRLTISF